MTSEDVRDLFECLIDARRELERKRHRIEALRSPAMSSGIAHAIQGSESDPTAIAGCALADEADDLGRSEDDYHRRLEDADALICGIRKGLGSVFGDILEDRYVRGLAYDTVARINNMSRTTVCRYRDTAFDAIASVGTIRAREGDFNLLANDE